MNVRPRRYWLHSRETILLLCVLGLAVAFAVTGFATRLYHGRRAELARSWFDRGNAELTAGRSQQALSDFRAALVYAQRELPAEEQERFELDFVRALLATGNIGEARAYLLDMWERAPGNSEVNLQLARLAASRGDEADAKRYYDGAINGVWDQRADQVLRSRTDTHLELYRYLMDRGEKAEAQAQLLAIAASLPPDAALQAKVGQLMLQTGEARQALDEFERALRLDSRNYQALAGAGKAQFQLGNDQLAVRYLAAAVRQYSAMKRTPGSKPEADLESEESQLSQDLAIAQQVLALNPHVPGLDADQRAHRAVRAYSAALTRTRSCADEHGVASPEPSRSLTPFIPASSDARAEAALAQHIQQLDSFLEFVFKMESAATENCGPPSDPTNAAILRLANQAQLTPWANR
jgi:tetratricopeptide (TPR) repeat protein